MVSNEVRHYGPHFKHSPITEDMSQYDLIDGTSRFRMLSV